METHKLFTCMEIDHSMFRPTSGFEVRSKYYDECLEKAFRKWLARTLKGKNKKILCMFGPPGCGKTSFLEHLAKHFDIDVADERAGDFFLHVPDVANWKREWHRKNALAGSTNGFPPNLPLFDSLFIPVKKISLAYQDIDMGKVIEELKNVQKWYRKNRKKDNSKSCGSSGRWFLKAKAGWRPTKNCPKSLD